MVACTGAGSSRIVVAEIAAVSMYMLLPPSPLPLPGSVRHSPISCDSWQVHMHTWGLPMSQCCCDKTFSIVTLVLTIFVQLQLQFHS